MATPISALIPTILDRVEETTPPVWVTIMEVQSAIAEAINDAMLMIGRPTQIVDQPYEVTPNLTWQPMPSGMIAITDIQGPSSRLWKYTLRDMDYTQSWWTSSWQNDVAQVSQGQFARAWFPLGFTMFGIYPKVSSPVTVTLTGIATPVNSAWPYTGNEPIPFHDEFFTAIEDYAAHYLRFKEGGNEFSESIKLLQSYIATAKRMTEIEDRRDPYIFSSGFGLKNGVNPPTSR